MMFLLLVPCTTYAAMKANDGPIQALLIPSSPPFKVFNKRRKARVGQRNSLGVPPPENLSERGPITKTASELPSQLYDSPQHAFTPQGISTVFLELLIHQFHGPTQPSMSYRWRAPTTKLRLLTSSSGCEMPFNNCCFHYKVGVQPTNLLFGTRCNFLLFLCISCSDLGQ